jgi:hypothetical protein
VAGLCEHSGETSGFVEGRDIPDCLRQYSFFKDFVV